MMNMQGDDVMELDYGYQNWNKYEDMNGISIRQRRQAVASMFPEVTFGQVNFQQTALVKIPLLIRTSPTANIFDFVECLVMESEVRPPDIILSIITNPSDHKSFKLYYHREQFIVGMQNIMETSSIWIITHGRDCGIVSLLGEALHRYQESIEYQNKWCETLRKQMNFMSNVSLISIVNEKDVLENGGSYSKFMDDTLERTILHLAQIDGSYYLNKHHSIHIVVTNNNISSGCLNDPAENFRCRFEKHLYTHVVPKLKISTHLNALRPRELQLYKFKSNDVEVELTFRWRNPYYASKYYNFFEDFVMIVYGCIHPLSKEKEELKSVSMKPKRDVMYCTVKIIRDYQQHLVFVLYSRTLYGSSQEASYYVDLSKFPCNNKRKSMKDPVFINLEMYLDCIASDTAVCVNFTPYLTSSHIKIMIRSLDQDKSQWSEQHTIETGVSVFHFTGLTPNTMYEVSIEPLKITESKILRMAGPFTKCFQTKVRDTFSDTTCEVYDDNLNVTTPMIYLVCGGNSDNIKKILHCINTRSAGILIMEGTRGAADVIGVSIDIHSERPTKLEDDDLIREVLLKYLYIEMFKKENTDHPKIREVLELLINIGKFCEVRIFPE
ncbi:hypothetical protein GJ496_008642 [Pomphorhynchus laevis]|nr:hypothetical protein GJ496_008642 [Pomphorhynchus laevis]